MILWQQEGSQFVMKQVLSSHTAAVTCLAAIHLQPSREGEEITSLIASGSSDSTAIIWERRSKDGGVCMRLETEDKMVFPCRSIHSSSDHLLWKRVRTRNGLFHPTGNEWYSRPSLASNPGFPFRFSLFTVRNSGKKLGRLGVRLGLPFTARLIPRPSLHY